MQISNFSTNTLVSTYASFLGAAPTLMGLMTGMFYGISLAMRPIAGPVQARVDHKKLLILVYVLGCVANAGYALFHTIPLFLLFRVLHGVEYAFFGSLCMTVAADSVPRAKLASGMGFYGLSSSVAQAFAPQLGISLRAWGAARGGEDFGYSALFLFSVLMMLLALIPVCSLRSEKAEILTDNNPAVREKWYRSIVSRHALPPALIVLLLMMSFAILNAYMVPLGEELGIKNIGLFFTVFAGAMLVIRPVSGWLSDRFGLQKMMVPSILSFCAAFLLIGSAASMPLILVGALLASFGDGTSNPATQALSVLMEPRERRAVASNTLYIGMDIGLFVGPLLGGMVLDFAGSYRAVLLGGSVPLALALVVLFITWKPCKRRIEAVAAMESAHTPSEN
ncbi:MAG: MFS transporter [Oscillospiraceae bacterium]|nr:MFS transporter [Oscillospiraceae bacterium]